MRAVQSKPDHDVAYVTDVEGSWTRLASFCANNPIVTLDGETLRVRAGATFVFGGDAIDRGPWSRRIVRTLLNAREAQPDQVVLLGGNRDLNKLRLARELEGFPPKRAPDDVRAVAHRVLDHRILVRGLTRWNREASGAVIDEVIGRLPVPGARSTSPN